MKNCIILLVALLAVLSVRAEQHYVPYIQDGNEWVMLSSIDMGYKQYSIGNRVTIDGIDYCEIKYAFCSGPNKAVSEPKVWGYARETDQKVYFGLEGSDRLVYDFGAQPGDTISYDHTDLYFTIVNSVCTQYIYGKDRLVLDVTHYPIESYDKSTDTYLYTIDAEWIEGIGGWEDVFSNEGCYRMGMSGTPDQFYYFYNPVWQNPYPENYELIDFDRNINHDYIPLVVEGKAWVSQSRYYPVCYQIAISGTEIVNDIEYHKLYQTERDLHTGEILTQPVMSGYIREADKKVYYKGISPECSEVLMYDFGANVGDIVTESDNRSDYYITVDSIDTETYYNKERSVYYISCWSNIDGNAHKEGNDMLIEGVGSVKYAAMEGSYIGSWSMSGSNIFKYYYDYNTDEIFPIGENRYTEFTMPAAHINSITTDNVTLSLCRSGNILMAVFPVVDATGVISLYDVQGRIVATQTIGKGATTANIDVNNLPAGLYIVHIGSDVVAKVVL